jgi:acyl-CoA thioesterase I
METHALLVASLSLVMTASFDAQQIDGAHAERQKPLILGAARSQLTYVVLGDSTAAGVGGGNYDQGIAVSTTRSLARRFRVTMTNLSVSGARIDDVLKHQLPAAEGLHPDVVLLSVGANDVTHLTPIRWVRADFRAIVQRLTTANPKVRIVVTGSPDMGAPPRIPRLLRSFAGYRTKLMNAMFESQVAESGLAFAPIARKTGKLFRRNRGLFADDRFHPNDDGYATWIPVLNEALLTATNGFS